MRPVAAIDCGTNAVRLLIAHLDGERLVEHVRLMRIVRLGEGVDRTGAFSDDALARTFAALDEYAAVIKGQEVEDVRFVATSASRDVSNRGAFVAGVLARLGVEPEVISGDEEAGLSFVGALRGLPAGLVRPPALVVDIGGGSTEFVLGSTTPEAVRSVDIGCVRMTERHLHSDPPTDAEIDRTWTDVRAAVATAGEAVPFQAAGCFVGLAGTVTTVAAMALDLPAYDESILHGSVVSFAAVERATARLLAMTRAERAALPYMHPGRVDVIGGGAMVLQAAMAAARAPEVIVSETDILDGIVYRLAAQ
jgi:exopolyphosphatase/guanosine-5'-triphosphate,3'-diphosphate pyrophosphatase